MSTYCYVHAVRLYNKIHIANILKIVLNGFGYPTSTIYKKKKTQNTISHLITNDSFYVSNQTLNSDLKNENNRINNYKLLHWISQSFKKSSKRP